MNIYLGIDTSNYTTSIAAYCENGEMISEKKLLPVKEGEKGLRQSDALFHHVRQISLVLDSVLSKLPHDYHICAVAASVKPRDVENSYMPCFLAGKSIGYSIAKCNNIPFYELSHQTGHIVAALYGANRFDLLNKPFISFHISGGTTEGLLVQPNEETFCVNIVSKSMDLSAGQLVDRIGVKSGMSFPAGAEVDKKAMSLNEFVSAKPVIKGNDICLSGVENICDKLKDEGASIEYISSYCLSYISEALVRVTLKLRDTYNNLPVLYAGGVMSSTYIRNYISSRVDNVIFTKPQFSSDNAAGIAYLAKVLFDLNK